MEADLQTHVAFYLTEKRTSPSLDGVDKLDLRPALFAGYRDLTQLRYDYPVVLGPKIRPLKSVFDQAFRDTAHEADAERLMKHGLRLEREIRVLIAAGKKGKLSALWNEAANNLEQPLRENLGRLRKVVTLDGDVVGCDKALPEVLLKHAWTVVQGQKGQAFRDKLDRLLLQLRDILKADFVGSNAGRTSENLEAAFGSSAIDFDKLSNLLTAAVPESKLPESRRKRIEALVLVLSSQPFVGSDGKPGQAFVFDNCEKAVEAYRKRLPRATELAKAIAIAELEVLGGYNEAKHDSFFADFGATGLDPADMAELPDILICLSAGEMTASENEHLAEILSAGLLIKVLVLTDDILEATPLAEGHIAIGSRCRQLANMAIGLSDVFVLQTPGSNLVKLQESVFAGLRYPGPAVFSVFSGANEFVGAIPPYLVGAAAMESRAFPAFVYDPGAGSNWAARFRLDDNQQIDRDWPSQKFAYEDESLQRMSEDVAFTLVDFVACDRRFNRHFARVPRENWNGTLTSVEATIQENRPRSSPPERVPSILMVDGNNVLQRVLVGANLIREAKRCAEMWHSLQELGGVRNSHAERLLEDERKVWEDRLASAMASQKTVAVVAEPVAAGEAAPVASTAVVAAPEPVEEPKSDDPYIETPRCTTCNECTTINNKMFSYNENKQAYVADPSAGTYKQLVEAAESCQVSIIHPGKPRNPKEPGLEELLKRAEPFL